MKKQKFVVCAIAIAIIILSIAAYFFFPIKPFSRLNTDDVRQIHVYAIPPETTMELTSDEISEAVDLLKNLVVYQPNYIAEATVGQMIRFTIVYTDGTVEEVAISGDVSLNGKSYRANYESAEALNMFANQIMK